MEFIALLLNKLDVAGTSKRTDNMNELIKNMIFFLVDISQTDCTDTRKLSMQFIGIIIESMRGKPLDDDVFEVLVGCVLDRSADVSSKVRIYM